MTSGSWRDVGALPPRLTKHAAVWTDAFDYCRSLCRTNSKSTVHENAYVQQLDHHCYGPSALAAP